VGYAARGDSFGAALGYAARGDSFGAALGYVAEGYDEGAAVGDSASGYHFGAAVGAGAKGMRYGVAVGYSAGYSIDTTADRYNVLIGAYSGFRLTTGIGNIIIGYQSGYDATYSPTTGSYNILIGYKAWTPSTTTSNFLNIGGLIFGTNLSTTTNTISSGNVGIGTTTPSSKLEVFNGNIEINDAQATGTYKILGKRNFYAGDETQISSTSTSPEPKKQFTSVLDSLYGIKPRYINVIARIWNSGGYTTTLNVTLEGCAGTILTTTSTSPTAVRGSINVAGCGDGLYTTKVYLSTSNSLGTAYNDLIEFYYVE
jgi:hypothetical protein